MQRSPLRRELIHERSEVAASVAEDEQHQDPGHDVGRHGLRGRGQRVGPHILIEILDERLHAIGDADLPRDVVALFELLRRLRRSVSQLFERVAEIACEADRHAGDDRHDGEEDEDHTEHIEGGIDRRNSRVGRAAGPRRNRRRPSPAWCGRPRTRSTRSSAMMTAATTIATEVGVTSALRVEDSTPEPEGSTRPRYL